MWAGRVAAPRPRAARSVSLPQGSQRRQHRRDIFFFSFLWLLMMEAAFNKELLDADFSTDSIAKQAENGYDTKAKLLKARLTSLKENSVGRDCYFKN